MVIDFRTRFLLVRFLAWPSLMFGLVTLINEHPLRSDTKTLHGWSNLAYVLVYYSHQSNTQSTLFFQFVCICTDSFLCPRFYYFQHPYCCSSTRLIPNIFIINIYRNWVGSSPEGLFSIIHVYNQANLNDFNHAVINDRIHARSSF